MKPSNYLPVLHPDSLSPEHAAYLADNLKECKSALRGVLPDTKAHTRNRVAEFLHLLSQGTTHRQATTETGLKFSELGILKAKHEGLEALWKAAVESGERIRQEIREEALDKRGVKGWEEPIYQGGKLVGHRRLFSDNCLELAVKGGDKEGKYSDKSTVKHEGAVIQFNITGVPVRGSTDNAPAIEADSVEIGAESQPNRNHEGDNA